jgi:hypothetical protein
MVSWEPHTACAFIYNLVLSQIMGVISNEKSNLPAILDTLVNFLSCLQESLLYVLSSESVKKKKGNVKY